jgi:hypothetical protein
MANNKWHYAPVIRQMEDARVTAGLLMNLASVGYTIRAAQEGAGTVCQPTDYPANSNDYFYFGGQQIAPTP